MKVMVKKLSLNVDGIELTKADIKKRFNEYNIMYFDGKLGDCKFYWMSPNQNNYGKYVAQPSPKGIISKIGISRNTVWNEDGLRELMLHEMIHMYTRTIEGKKLDGIFGHGCRFRAHCKRLKNEYGLIIRTHSDFGYKNKKLHPKLWDRVLTWLVDW